MKTDAGTLFKKEPEYAGRFFGKINIYLPWIMKQSQLVISVGVECKEVSFR